MRKIILIGGLLMAGISCAAEVSGQSFSELQRMKASELAQFYGGLSTGRIPRGNSKGRAIFFPGTAFTYPAGVLASLVWQGKIFELEEGAEKGMLANRVFGFQAIRAQVFFGRSWYDGKESIIVDYLDTSNLFSFVRDEIREIGPDFYLGRAYARTMLGPQFVLSFALDFR